MEIDDLTAAMAGSASVQEPGVYSSSSPHPRFAQYKSSGWVKNSQEKRRQELLERQKKSRDEKVQEMRIPVEIAGSEEVEVEKSSDSKYKTKREFDNELMLSEWLVDVPENFEANWLMVPVPVGRRSLVVAARGITRCYSKTGYQRFEFRSPLPGGSSKRGKTLLDCILSDDSTFYVLDGIYLANQPIGQGERNFRYFMLKSLFDDHPELSSGLNAKKFILLPQFACNIRCIEDAVKSDFGFELDGLLFYCNHAHYEPGLTPLVGWLKPFMLREILNVQSLPEKYAPPVSQSADRHVTTAAEFRADFEANLKKQTNEVRAKKPSSSPRSKNTERMEASGAKAPNAGSSAQ